MNAHVCASTIEAQNNGFIAKDAEQPFVTYERTRSRIEVGADTITIHTTMAGFN